MNPNERAFIDENGAERLSGARWVSTATAATRLGVSERTVLRRAASGALESRKETTARGVVVLVALDCGDVPTSAATGADGADARLAEHLATENRFLRGVVEQLQRDGAETRAALREALRIAPRQLSAGASSTNEPGARNAQDGPQNGAAGDEGAGTVNGPQIEPKRAESGVSSDEMSEAELLALCERICSRGSP